MDRKGWWALCCLLVVGGAAVGMSATVGADRGTISADSQHTASLGDGGIAAAQETAQLEYHDHLENASEVHIEIDLQEDGDAIVRVEHRFEDITDDSWVNLRTEIENESTAYAEREEAAWAQIAAEGANATTREMRVSAVDIEAVERPAPRQVGQIIFEFEWSGFAYVELNRLEVDEVLTGFTLVEGTSLQVTWPDRYVVTEIEPEPVQQPSESARWNGDETEFTDGQPSILLLESADDTEMPRNESDEESDSSWPIVLSGLVIATVLGVTMWRYWHRRQEPSVTVDRETAPAVDDGANESPTDNRPPMDLLSNEERVLRLLADNGGRIKQQEVVADLEWTEAKTSQVVSRLREDDEIEVFRVGRENVLALPEDE